MLHYAIEFTRVRTNQECLFGGGRSPSMGCVPEFRDRALDTGSNVTLIAISDTAAVGFNGCWFRRMVPVRRGDPPLIYTSGRGIRIRYGGGGGEVGRSTSILCGLEMLPPGV